MPVGEAGDRGYSPDSWYTARAHARGVYNGGPMTAAGGLLLGTFMIVSLPLAALWFGPTAAALGMMYRVRYGLFVATAAAISKGPDAPVGPGADIPVYTPSQLGALTGTTPTRSAFTRLARLAGHSAFAWWVWSSTIEHQESSRTKAALRRKKSRSGFTHSGARHFKHGY